MNAALLKRLIEVRKNIIKFENGKRRYKLAQFDNTYMEKDCIVNTPFRCFEAVPQGKPSSRRQNDNAAFDPYEHTVFDYPLVIKTILRSNLDALRELNYQLTVQVPYCGMDCWHCYNDKRVCAAGFLKAKVPMGEFSARDILDRFAGCCKLAQGGGPQYNVLRVSGGEPFLVPELIAELLHLMRGNKSNEYYPKFLWTETNLVTWAPSENDGSFVVRTTCSEAKEQDGLDICEVLRDNKDRLVIHPCFHGLSDDNIEKCTLPTGLGFTADLSFDNLLQGFRNLHDFLGDEEHLHLFPTFIGDACDPDGVERLFKGLWDVDRSYPLKLAVVRADFYGPIPERFEAKRGAAFFHSRLACLRRWDSLIRKHYGLSYGQLLRPLAESAVRVLPTVAPGANTQFPGYDPVVFLLKSTGRKEYRQELLSILGAPPNTEIMTTYDTDHVQPEFVNWLKSRYADKDLDHVSIKAVITYCNSEAGRKGIPYLPLRHGTIRKVQVTNRFIHITTVLQDYVIPANGKAEQGEKVLKDFRNRMIEYFGRVALLEPSDRHWVLLGEQALLQKGFSGESDEPLFRAMGSCDSGQPNRDELRRAWDNLLDLIKGSDTFADLREYGVFLQLLPVSAFDCDGEDSSVIGMNEGSRIDFELRFYVPDFGEYDKGTMPKESRTLRIVSEADAIHVRGYQPKPLSKYGELSFQVVCEKVDRDVPGRLVIESEDQSCYCARFQLDFALKKNACCAELST